ncbi:MAG: universal stress protein [Gemmatimonadota bacterium]
MYTKILVPLDGSALAERAVIQAEEIAKATGAELIFLQVVPAPLGKAPEAGQDEEIKALLESAAQARAYLGMVATRAGGAGVKSRFEVMEGAPAAGILAFAHDNDVDLIVMSTHGRSGVSKLVMGSVAEKVMLTTRRPVLLVKPERLAETHIDESDVFLSAH